MAIQTNKGITSGPPDLELSIAIASDEAIMFVTDGFGEVLLNIRNDDLQVSRGIYKFTAYVLNRSDIHRVYVEYDPYERTGLVRRMQ